jgi:hypothetical protein
LDWQIVPCHSPKRGVLRRVFLWRVSITIHDRNDILTPHQAMMSSPESSSRAVK